MSRSVFNHRRVPNAPVSLDSSGNALHLFIQEDNTDLTWGNPGPFSGGDDNYAVSSTGTTAIKAIGSTNTTSLFNLTSLTYSGWFYLNNTADVADSVMGYMRNTGDNGADWSWYSRGNNTNPSDIRHLLGSGFDYTRTGFYSRAAWHHLAFVANGTDWTLYRDGTSITSSATPAQPPGSGNKLYIGGAPAFGAGYKGRIAGVALFGSALSGAQIAAHAAANATYAAYKSAVLADSPVGLWMLDSFVYI
jgi:hypothetical protein